MKLYESTNSGKNLKGQKTAYFSLKGNGKSGNVTRTGWKPSRLGEAKKAKIAKALKDTHIDKVYRRGNKIYANMINGIEVSL